MNAYPTAISLLTGTFLRLRKPSIQRETAKYCDQCVNWFSKATLTDATGIPLSDRGSVQSRYSKQTNASSKATSFNLVSVVAAWSFRVAWAYSAVVTLFLLAPGLTLADDRALDVAAGGNHSCAITSSSSVMCWGDDFHGQLGDNDGPVLKPVPVATVGLRTGVVAISAGLFHTCAIATAAKIYCWGNNNNGQIGIDDFQNTLASVPTPVAAWSDRASAIAAGYLHTCALTESAVVKCWGSNINGQLGRGMFSINSIDPTSVSGLSGDVIAVAAGGFHNCALTSQGAVYCWGANESGQLGNNSSNDSSLPVRVANLPNDVVAITAGRTHTCALRGGGELVCWGFNESGQLGDGTNTTRWTPVAVASIGRSAKAVAAGGDNTCVIDLSDRVLCWGYNYTGQIGNGGFQDRNLPVLLTELTHGISKLSVGANHTCAVTLIGSVQCWGNQGGGQIGSGQAYTGERVLNSAPKKVRGFGDQVSALTVGHDHACARIGVDLKCWGRNFINQFGNGALTDAATPVQIAVPPTGIVSVSAGNWHTCVVVAAGGIRCWGGNNSYGQVGTRQIYDLLPVEVPNVDRASVAVVAGDYHNCALSSTGGAKCWGHNGYGQLGRGSSDENSNPGAEDVVGMTTGVRLLASGSHHSCAVVASGVKCWGRNDVGQLGDGSTVFSTTPVSVTGISGTVVGLVAGGLHTCAILSSGGVRCWGEGGVGQLGNGAFANSSTPVAVDGLSTGVLAVSAGRFHTCALLAAGNVKCWGYNARGEMGDGTSTYRASPIDVIGLSGGVSGIASGESTTCASLTTGGAMCWGGDVMSSVPVDVVGFSPETTPMIEFRHGALDYYFVTSKAGEIAVLDGLSAWQRTGATIPVYSKALTGGAGINRFYFDKVALNGARGSHFYTTDASEVASLVALNPTNSSAPRLPFREGVDSYAFEPRTTNSSQTCPLPLTPVYRLFRGGAKFPDNPNHRFTRDMAVYASFVAAGWSGEGIGFCVPSEN